MSKLSNDVRRHFYKNLLEPIRTNLRSIRLINRPFFGKSPEGAFLRRNMIITNKGSQSFEVTFRDVPFGGMPMESVVEKVNSSGIPVDKILLKYANEVLAPQILRHIGKKG